MLIDDVNEAIDLLTVLYRHSPEETSTFSTVTLRLSYIMVLTIYGFELKDI